LEYQRILKIKRKQDIMKKIYKKLENCNIYGNNHNINLIYGFQLTNKEKREFDYIDNIDDNFTGFRYNKRTYGLDEFLRIEKGDPFFGFADAYISDSFFSGILIKIDEECETLRAYTFIS